MELIEKGHKGAKDSFFEEWDFELMDDGVKVCNLMVMATVPREELDLTVFTVPEYFRQGYATEGIRMLIKWAVQNGYKNVRLTNLYGSAAIGKIATKLGFIRHSPTVWTKSIIGPLNI